MNGLTAAVAVEWVVTDQAGRAALACIAILMALAPLAAADWLTGGGSTKRTAWQQNETILNVENVKNLKVLWKLQFDNMPHEMHSLFPR